MQRKKFSAVGTEHSNAQLLSHEKPSPREYKLPILGNIHAVVGSPRVGRKRHVTTSAAFLELRL
jgi:hypothetical protein